MLIDDPLYGEAQVSDPVLIELLASEAMVRLRGVLQHGISGLIGLTPPITRFDHSQGVFLLVRRLGGSLSEQIAALLHDVSHTAFSHVMDHIFDSPDSQAFHERVKAGYMQSTDLPAVLARHGFDWRIFLDETRFTLLEQPAPALCADRLDYFLRDALAFGLADLTDIERVLNHLLVFEERLVVNDVIVGRWLGETFMRADDHSWSNFNEVGLYELTARALRHGFESGHLHPEDIWLTDAELWARMAAADDDILRALLAPIRPDVRFVWDDARPTFMLSTKIRTIDPGVLLDGELRPLSAWEPSFGRRRAAYLQRKGGMWPMRLVGNRAD